MPGGNLRIIEPVFFGFGPLVCGVAVLKKSDPCAACKSFHRPEVEEAKKNTGRMVEERVMTDDQLAEFARQLELFSNISRTSIKMSIERLDPEADKQRRSHKSGFRGSTIDRAPGATRPRWKPTHVHLSVLEYIFENSDLLPGDKDITLITDALRLYGPVEEVNVFYWFQNRRARAKRSQQNGNQIGNQA